MHSRRKSEDLFKLLCKHNNEFRNARSKTKIQGYPKGTVQPSAVSSLPLSCLLKKDGHKDFRLCENKGIDKKGETELLDVFL
jgi:hypothetical protein